MPRISAQRSGLVRAVRGAPRMRQNGDMPAEETQPRDDDAPLGDEVRGGEPRGSEARGDELRGGDARGDEPRGSEARGSEVRGDEARSDEVSGDEARGDGARGTGARGERQPGEPGARPRLVRTAEERPALLRRQVRLGRFLGMGLIAAILAAMALTFFAPENPDFVPADPTLQFSQGQVFGFLLVYLSPIGIGLGGLVGLLVGRLAGRAERVTVTRHAVRAAEPGDEDEVSGPGEAPGTREA